MQSDWAALPFQVLTDAFESQSNALDNCAAVLSHDMQLHGAVPVMAL